MKILLPEKDGFFSPEETKKVGNEIKVLAGAKEHGARNIVRISAAGKFTLSSKEKQVEFFNLFVSLADRGSRANRFLHEHFQKYSAEFYVIASEYANGGSLDQYVEENCDQIEKNVDLVAETNCAASLLRAVVGVARGNIELFGIGIIANKTCGRLPGTILALFNMVAPQSNYK